MENIDYLSDTLTAAFTLIVVPPLVWFGMYVIAILMMALSAVVVVRYNSQRFRDWTNENPTKFALLLMPPVVIGVMIETAI